MSGHATARYLIALLSALAITYGLFFIMFQLTRGDSYDLVLPNYDSLRIDFIRLQEKKEEVEQKRHLPEKPKFTQRPALPDFPRQNILPPSRLEMLPLHLPELPRLNSGLNLGSIGSADITPLYRAQPIYPLRAQSRGIEGWVKVEFSIDKSGNVVNPHVVDAQPEGIFERAALKAISRWRYQPRIINGVAVMRDQVRVMIEFKLE